MGRKVNKMQYDIAARLLLLRLRMKPNASEMARSLNLTPQSWYNYESGRRTLDLVLAARIIETYNLDWAWLCGGRAERLKKAVRERLMADDPSSLKPARRKQRSTPPNGLVTPHAKRERRRKRPAL